MTRDLDFLITATPGSGSRALAALLDAPGAVRVAALSGFWSRLPSLARRFDFPLRGTDRRDAVAWLLEAGSLVTDRPLSPADVEAALGAGAATPWALHAALVLAAAGGAGEEAPMGADPLAPSEVTAVGNARAGSAQRERIGVVSDDALAWWWPLSRVRPDLRWIGVLRDPRELAALAPAEDPHRLAWSWREDLRCLRLAHRELGSARVRIVRHRDLARDPEALRASLGSFLEAPAGAPSARSPERPGAGSPDGSAATAEADAAALRVVLGLCGRAMAREGWPGLGLPRPVAAGPDARATIRALREARAEAARFPLAGLVGAGAAPESRDAA